MSKEIRDTLFDLLKVLCVVVIFKALAFVFDFSAETAMFCYAMVEIYSLKREV